MTSTFISCLCLLVVLGSAVAYHAGFVVSLVVQLLARRRVKWFRIDCISFYPFAVTGIELTLRATRSSPEATLRLDGFRILFDVWKLLDPPPRFIDGDSATGAPVRREPALCFLFDGLFLSSSSLWYEFFLDPSSSSSSTPPVGPPTSDCGGDIGITSLNTKRYSWSSAPAIVAASSVQQLLMRFVGISFNELGFHFEFPAHGSKVVGHTARMSLLFPGTTGSPSMRCAAHFDQGGVLEIFQSGEQALRFDSGQAVVVADLHIPSKIQEVSVSLRGDKQEMHVHVEAFLVWLARYQAAEDNSAEKKMALGLRVSGNMSVYAQCDAMTVLLRDPRCPGPLRLSLQQWRAGLKSYFLTGGDSAVRTYKGQPVYGLLPERDQFYAATGVEPCCCNSEQSSPDPSHQPQTGLRNEKPQQQQRMSSNRDKVMSAAILRMEFHTEREQGQEGGAAVIDSVHALKVQRELNEGRFIDEDRQEGFIGSVRFEDISADLLDWLVVLKDTADRIPSSRFSHDKNSHVLLRVPVFIFSTQPVSFEYLRLLNAKGGLQSTASSRATAAGVPHPIGCSEHEQEHMVSLVGQVVPLNELHQLPLDRNRSAVFSFSDLEVTKTLSSGDTDSSFEVRSTLFRAETVTLVDELCKQFNVETPGRPPYHVPPGSGRADLHRPEEEECVTGTRFLFPSLAVRFRSTAVGPAFESFRSEVFECDLSNGPDVHAGMVYSPFASLSAFDMVWMGPRTVATLGSLHIEGSAAGAVKAKLGWDTLRAGSQRVTARMEYMSAAARSKSPPCSAPTAPPPNPSDDDRIPMTTMIIPYIEVTIAVTISPEFEIDYAQLSDSKSSDAAIDRKTKKLKLILSNFKALSSFGDISNSVQFERLDAKLTNYPEHPLLVLNGFRMDERVVSLGPNDSFLEGLPRNVSNCMSHLERVKSKTVVGITLDRLLMHASVRMELGPIADFLSSQMAAYCAAVQSTSDDSHGEDLFSYARLLSYSPYQLIVALDHWEVSMDAHYGAGYEAGFLSLRGEGVQLSVDSTKHPVAVQDQLTALDRLPSDCDDCFLYDPVSGGFVCASFRSLKVAFRSAPDALLVVDSASCNGTIYYANIIDPRIAIQSSEVLLSDSSSGHRARFCIPPLQPSTQENNQACLLRPSTARGACLPLYARTSKSAAPRKIYLDLSMDCHSAMFAVHPSTLQSIDAVNAVVDCIALNNDTSPSLSIWDSLRYWMHGNFTCSARQLYLHVHAEDYMTQRVTLRVSVESLRWFLDSSSFSTTTQNIVVDAEVTSKLIGNPRRSNVTAARSSSGGSSSHSAVVTKLFSIPAMVMSLRHSADVARQEGHQTDHPNQRCGFSHHDVHLQPVSSPADKSSYYYDKFESFRSDRSSFKWEVEMRVAAAAPQAGGGGGEAAAPIHFNLRVDHIVCVIDALMGHSRDRTQTPACGGSSSVSVGTRIYNKSLRKSAIDHPQMIDLASTIELQLMFDKVMVSSWPSDINRGGFVMEVGGSDVQLRLKRGKAAEEGDEALQPLKIDHFYVETSLVELYVRDWSCLPLTGGPSSTRPSMDRRAGRGRISSSRKTADTSPPSNSYVDIARLFEPIHKLGHCSKMLISLTESGEVCRTDGAFVKTGVLEWVVLADTGDSRQGPSFVIGKDRAALMRQSRPIVTAATSALHRLVLHPRKSAHYFRRRTLSSNPSPSSVCSAASGGGKNHRHRRTNTRAAVDETSSFGNKIWGLRVTDLRLLFTIAIRDILFGYVARTMDLLTAGDGVDVGKDIPEATAGNPLPNLSSRPQSIHLSKPQPPERASLSDFKDLSAETALLLQQRGEVVQWKKGGPDWLSPELKGSDIVKHMLLAKRGGSSSNQQLRRAEPIVSQQLRNAEYKNTTGQCFFVVELIDPQVNFLDVKTHSSLIIVAGHSSLEGRRSTQAWTSSRVKAAAVEEEAKRKQVVLLRMDDVSAFTVPSSPPADQQRDIVHWKMMKSTSLSDRGGGSDPPLMRMAIKDFQIRAQYIFWTDITAKQAKHMHVERTKDDLVCAFKLDLPAIVVDIVSLQFYAIVHVVRNVLLVPPPASAQRSNPSQADVDRETKQQQVLELQRDFEASAASSQQVLSQSRLDIEQRQCREEIKDIVERKLADAIKEMELGSSRLVECLIGSCSWILRSSDGVGLGSSDGAHNETTTGDSERKQLEVFFTGIQATFFYGEDRASVSSFEVQQFWIRDMSPDRDNYSAAVRTKRRNDACDSSTKATVEEEKMIVLMPSVGQGEKCSRCGTAFSMDKNHASACTFHANADGEEGRYCKEVGSLSFRDDLTVPLQVSATTSSSLFAWSCCSHREESAPGCCARPHICKEVMIRIGAEAYPKARIENIDLSVLKSVDITFFPNSSAYDLKVRVNKSLTDLLHSYFSIKAVDSYSDVVVPSPAPEVNTSLTGETKPSNKRWNKLKAFKKMMTMSGKKSSSEKASPSIHSSSAEEVRSPARERDNSSASLRVSTTNLGDCSKSSPTNLSSPAALSPMSLPSHPGKGPASDEYQESSQTPPGSPWLTLPSIKKQFNRLISPHKSNHPSKRTEQPVIASAGSERQQSTHTQPHHDDNRPDREGHSAVKGSQSSTSSGRQEGVYIKFFRLGEIRIEVCTTGFLINLNGFRAEVNEFRCQGECMLWSQLVWKLEQHAAISLIKNAAKGSLSKMTNALTYSGGANDAVDSPDDQPVWEKEQDSAVADSMKRSALGLSIRKMK